MSNRLRFWLFVARSFWAAYRWALSRANHEQVNQPEDAEVNLHEFFSDREGRRD